MADELHAKIIVEVEGEKAAGQKIDEVADKKRTAEIEVKTTGADAATKEADKVAGQVQDALAGVGQVDLGKTIAGNVAKGAKDVQKTLTDATKKGVQAGVEAGVKAGLKAGAKETKKVTAKMTKDQKGAPSGLPGFNTPQEVKQQMAATVADTKKQLAKTVAENKEIERRTAQTEKEATKIMEDAGKHIDQMYDDARKRMKNYSVVSRSQNRSQESFPYIYKKRMSDEHYIRNASFGRNMRISAQAGISQDGTPFIIEHNTKGYRSGSYLNYRQAHKQHYGLGLDAKGQGRYLFSISELNGDRIEGVNISANSKKAAAKAVDKQLVALGIDPKKVEADGAESALQIEEEYLEPVRKAIISLGKKRGVLSKQATWDEVEEIKKIASFDRFRWRYDSDSLRLESKVDSDWKAYKKNNPTKGYVDFTKDERGPSDSLTPSSVIRNFIQEANDLIHREFINDGSIDDYLSPQIKVSRDKTSGKYSISMSNASILRQIDLDKRQVQALKKEKIFYQPPNIRGKRTQHMVGMHDLARTIGDYGENPEQATANYRAYRKEARRMLKEAGNSTEQAINRIEEGQKEDEELQKIADEVEKKRDANDKKLGEIVKKKNLTVAKGSKIAGKRYTQAQQRGLAEYEQRLQEIEEERAKARSDAAKEYYQARIESRTPYESFEIPKTKGQVFAIESPFGKHYRTDEEAELLEKKYNVMQLTPYTNGINRGLVSIDGYFPTSGFLTAASNFDRQARALGFTTNLTERYRNWQADYERFDKDPRRAYSRDSESLQQTISELLEGKRLLEDPKSLLHDYLFNEDGTQKRTIEELEKFMYSTPQHVKYFSDEGLINLAMKARRYNMQRPETKKWLEEAYTAIGKSGFMTPPRELALRSFGPNKVHGYGMEFIGDDPEQGIYAWFNDIASDWNPNQQDLLGWVKEQKGWKRGKYTATNYKRGTTNGGIALADAGNKLERELKKIDQDSERERSNAEWLKYRYTRSRSDRYFRDRYRLNSESSGRLAGIRSNALLEYQAKQQQKIEKQVLKEIPDNQQELFDELRQEYAAKTQQSIAKADEAISILPEKVAPLVDELDVARGSDALFEKALLGVTEAMMGAEAEQNKAAQQFSSRALYKARTDLWKQVKSKGLNVLPGGPTRKWTTEEFNKSLSQRTPVPFNKFEDFSDVLQEMWNRGPEDSEEFGSVLFPDDPKKAALIAALFANNGEGLARADKYAKEQSAIRQVNKAKQRASTQVTQENKAWEQYWQEDEAYTKAMEERRAEADKYLSEHHDELTSYGPGKAPMISSAEKAGFWEAFDQVEHEAEQLLIADTQKLSEARRVREAAATEAQRVANENEERERRSEIHHRAQPTTSRRFARPGDRLPPTTRRALGYDWQDSQRRREYVDSLIRPYSPNALPEGRGENTNNQEMPYVLSAAEAQRLIQGVSQPTEELNAENLTIQANKTVAFETSDDQWEVLDKPPEIKALPAPLPLIDITGLSPVRPVVDESVYRPSGPLALPNGFAALPAPAIDFLANARQAIDATFTQREQTGFNRGLARDWAGYAPPNVGGAFVKMVDAWDALPSSTASSPVIEADSPVIETTEPVIINSEEPLVQETPPTPPRTPARDPEFDRVIQEMEENNNRPVPPRERRTPPRQEPPSSAEAWVPIDPKNIARAREELKEGFNLSDAAVNSVMRGVEGVNGIEISQVDKVSVNYEHSIPGSEEGPDILRLSGRDAEGDRINLTRRHIVRPTEDGEGTYDYWENIREQRVVDFNAQRQKAEREAADAERAAQSNQKQMLIAQRQFFSMQNELTGSQFTGVFKDQALGLNDELKAAFDTLRAKPNTEGLQEYNQTLQNIRANMEAIASSQKSQAALDKFAPGANAKIEQATELANRLDATTNRPELRNQAGDLNADISHLNQAMSDWRAAIQSNDIGAQTNAMNAARVALAQLNAEYSKGSKAIKDYDKVQNGINKSLAEVGKIRSTHNLTQEQANKLDQIESKIRVSADMTELNTAKAVLDAFKSSLNKTAVAGKTFGTTLGAALKGLFPALSAFRLVSKGMQTFKQMVANVTAIDKSMTAFKQTAVATSAEFNSFLDNATISSKALAVNINDYVDAATEFSRLGESFADSATLGEAAIKLKNVGAGINNVTDASSYLISTMKGFGLASDDAMNIVDAMTYIGNNYPITAGGIGDALARSAASLSAAGNSMEQTMALITSGNAIVQMPERVGSALNVLSLRLRGSKADLQEAGESIDEYCESTSKMRDQVKALSGVDIMASATQYKDTYTILKEISEVWDSLTDINQAALTEALFGKMRANVGTSILSNFDIAENVLKDLTSGEAQNYTETAYGTYLDSIEAKSQQLKTTMQELSLEITNSGLINIGYDIGKDTLNTVGSIVGMFNNLAESVFNLNGGLKSLPGIVAVAYTALSRLGKVKMFDFTGQGQGLLGGVKYVSAAQTAMAKQNIAADQAILRNYFKTNSYVMAGGSLYNSGQASISPEDFAKLKNPGVYMPYLQKGMTEADLNKLGDSQNQALKSGFQLQKGAVSFGQTMKSVGMNILGMATQMAAVYAIMAGISWLMDKYDKHVNARKYSMQAAEEAYKDMKSVNSEITDRNKVVENNIETVLKYRESVDAQGKNRGLSTEEFREYQEAANALGEAMPDLVSYWDENGNAILKNVGYLEQYKQKLEEVNATQLGTSLNENAGKILKGARSRTKYTNTQIFGGNNAVDAHAGYDLLTQLIDVINNAELGDATKRNKINSMIFQAQKNGVMDPELLTNWNKIFGQYASTLDVFNDNLVQQTGSYIAWGPGGGHYTTYNTTPQESDYFVVQGKNGQYYRMTEGHRIDTATPVNVKTAQRTLNQDYVGIRSDTDLGALLTILQTQRASRNADINLAGSQMRSVASDYVTLLASAGFNTQTVAKFGGGQAGSDAAQAFAPYLQAYIGTLTDVDFNKIFDEAGLNEQSTEEDFAKVLSGWVQGLYDQFGENVTARTALAEYDTTSQAFKQGSATYGQMMAARRNAEANIIPGFEAMVSGVFDASTYETQAEHAANIIEDGFDGFIEGLTASQLAFLDGYDYMDADGKRITMTMEEFFDAYADFQNNLLNQWEDMTNALTEMEKNQKTFNTAIANQSKTGALSFEDAMSVLDANEAYGGALMYGLNGFYFDQEKAQNIMSQERQKLMSDNARAIQLNNEAITKETEKLEKMGKITEQTTDKDKKRIKTSEETIESLKKENAKRAVLIERLSFEDTPYGRWLAQQNGPEAGDAFRGLKAAVDTVEEGYKSGRMNTYAFKTSADVLFGEGNRSDWTYKDYEQAVESYKKIYKDGQLDPTYMHKWFQAAGVMNEKGNWTDNYSFDQLAEIMGESTKGYGPMGKQMLAQVLMALSEYVGWDQLGFAPEELEGFLTGTEEQEDANTSAVNANTVALNTLTAALGGFATQAGFKEQGNITYEKAQGAKSFGVTSDENGGYVLNALDDNEDVIGTYGTFTNESMANRMAGVLKAAADKGFYYSAEEVAQMATNSGPGAVDWATLAQGQTKAGSELSASAGELIDAAGALNEAAGVLKTLGGGGGSGGKEEGSGTDTNAGNGGGAKNTTTTTSNQPPATNTSKSTTTTSAEESKQEESATREFLVSTVEPGTSTQVVSGDELTRAVDPPVAEVATEAAEAVANATTETAEEVASAAVETAKETAEVVANEVVEPTVAPTATSEPTSTPEPTATPKPAKNVQYISQQDMEDFGIIGFDKWGYPIWSLGENGSINVRDFDNPELMSQKFSIYDRPRMTSAQMADLGWEINGDDYATIFSSSFGDGEGNEYLFTPLFNHSTAGSIGRQGMYHKPEGATEYDPDKYLEDYVTRFFETGEDPYGLRISPAYPSDEGGGSAALDDWAEAIHRVSETVEEFHDRGFDFNNPFEVGTDDQIENQFKKETEEVKTSTTLPYTVISETMEEAMAEPAQAAAEAVEEVSSNASEAIETIASATENAADIAAEAATNATEVTADASEVVADVEETPHNYTAGELASLGYSGYSATDLLKNWNGTVLSKEIAGPWKAQGYLNTDQPNFTAVIGGKNGAPYALIRPGDRNPAGADAYYEQVLKAAGGSNATQEDILRIDKEGLIGANGKVVGGKGLILALGENAGYLSQLQEQFSEENLSRMLSALETGRREAEKEMNENGPLEEGKRYLRNIEATEKREMEGKSTESTALLDLQKRDLARFEERTQKTRKISLEAERRARAEEVKGTEAKSYYDWLDSQYRADAKVASRRETAISGIKNILSDNLGLANDSWFTSNLRTDWSAHLESFTTDQLEEIFTHLDEAAKEKFREEYKPYEEAGEKQKQILEGFENVPDQRTTLTKTPSPEPDYSNTTLSSGNIAASLLSQYGTPMMYLQANGLVNKLLGDENFDWVSYDKYDPTNQMKMILDWEKANVEADNVTVETPQAPSLEAPPVPETVEENSNDWYTQNQLRLFQEFGGDASEFEAVQDEVTAAAEEPVTKPINGDPSGANAAIDEVRSKAQQEVTMPLLFDWHWRTGVYPSSVNNYLPFASGTPSAPGGPSLVGEAGNEIVVDRKRGEWHLTQGPELLNLNKGDIVFNAKQTTSMLNNYRALSGKAHEKGLGGKAYEDPLIKPLIDFAAKIGQGISSILGWNKQNQGGSSAGAGAGGKTAKEMSEVFNKLYDWIERWLAVAKERTDKLVNSIKDLVNYWSRNARIDDAIKAAKDEQTANRKAAARYRKQAQDTAKKYGLSNSFVKKIQEGKLDIESLSEETKTKVQEYNKWWQKAEAAENRIEELADQIKELQLSKFDNIIDYYTGRVDYRKSLQAVSAANVDYKKATGKVLTKYDYTPQLQALGFQRGSLKSERDAMQKQFDQLIKNGTIKEGDENYYKYKKAIADLDEQILKTDTDIQQVQDEINRIPLTKLEYALRAIQRIATGIQDIMSLNQAQNWTPFTDEDIKTYTGYYTGLIKNGMAQIKNLKDQRGLLEDQLVGLDKNSEKYQEIIGQIQEIDSQIASTMQNQEQWNDSIIDLQIKAQQKQRDELQKQNDQYKKQKELEEALLDLEKARSQRNKLVFREGELTPLCVVMRIETNQCIG